MIARAALALSIVPLLLGGHAFAQDDSWQLNERGYLEKPGANVLVFSSEYNGMFFDEKWSGIYLIHHGIRTTTGGAVRLSPAPEQWDQIPKLVDRKVDKEHATIEVVLRYEAFDFDSRVVVKPDGQGFSMAVYLDKPVPPQLEGRAGLNLEFLPSRYFERTYLMDGKPGLFARYPSGPTSVKPADTKIRQFEGYTTFEDRGRKEYVEPGPVATGKTLVLAPEDPERHVTIRAAAGELQLIDGRNVAQNGWFVVRSILPAKATGKVAEWFVLPHAIPGWKRAPVIGFSQVGYHPAQKKVAVVELDPRDAPLETATLFEVTSDGTVVERLKARVQPWGPYLRYSYVTADFSAVDQAGLYFIQYGSQKTGVFPIGPRVYDDIWHLTQDVWLPVQMDHMKVNEAYRVWHDAAHLDDARQAPVNFQHFDNYRMGPTTETRFKPGERIPGLAVGGWFDAGDFDIETAHHANAVLHLVDAWEAFRPMRDETLVDQAARFVDIHRPDGKPDILQQIEHGALMLAAQHRVFGRGIRGITDPLLYQYTHLGDGSTQTDNLAYDPTLGPYETKDGTRSGTPDDRWAFTARMPAVNYSTIAALAAASRALRGYNDAFAEECLALARKSYADERHVSATGRPRGEVPARRRALRPGAAPDLHRREAVRGPLRRGALAGAGQGTRLPHPHRRAGAPAPRCRVQGAAAAPCAEVPGEHRSAGEAEPVRRSDQHGRLGGQRRRDGVRGDQLPPPQGVSRHLRTGRRPQRPALHPGASPVVERLVRVRRRRALEDDRLRQQPRGLLVHRGRRRARRAGPEAGLPRAHGGLAVPLGRERVRGRHLRPVHLPGTGGPRPAGEVAPRAPSRPRQGWRR